MAVSKTQKTRPSTPFGDADGQRTEIESNFVPFATWKGWPEGISTGDHDFEARLLIGRKGSGKTVYMRRLQACAASSGSQLADEVQYQPPDTETILSFSRLFSDDESQVEWWAKLWNRCILRSLASHVMEGALQTHADAKTRQKLEEFTSSNYGKLLRNFLAPVPAYRQMDELVNERHTRNSMTEFLQNPYWSDLEALLANVLKNSPPFFMFLDALDEHFERSPRWWLKCQEGLFSCAMQMLRSAKWNRLHLTVSLRDIVHASMLRSEHRTRFTGDPRIRLLTWHHQAIEEFLATKLERLPRRYFVGDSKTERSLDQWLGRSRILNKRGTAEPISQYLLRHTRLLPRDVVILGNLLCRSIEKLQITPNLDLEAEIRNQVHEAASVFGREQFQICANEIISKYMPRCADNGCTEAFVANDDFSSFVAQDLEALVIKIGGDRFGRSTLQDLGEEGQKRFDCDVFSLMWRNGLLGYVEGAPGSESFVFYDHDSLNSFNLPQDCKEYVFHPIVIDATGIQASGPVPVVPFA